MRQQFETKAHFETYKNEQNSSLSANCNTLLALLLNLEDDHEAIPAIEKLCKSLATQSFNTAGAVKDKWVRFAAARNTVNGANSPQNFSEYYTTMLFAQSFMKMIQCWEAGKLASLSEELLRNRIILVTFRSLLRILLTQSSEGSWGSKGPREETAYAILALVELARLPMAFVFDQEIESALLRGRNYLRVYGQASKPEYLWVEKVLYGAKNLSQAYHLAALHAPRSASLDGQALKSLLDIDYGKISKHADMFRTLPLLASRPRWLILASWIEGQLFLPMLNEVRGVAFSRAGLTKDTYISWIPVIWTLANNMNGARTAARLLFDMMRVSVLNFQVDEFMETVVDKAYGNDISTMRGTIDDLFKDVKSANGRDRLQDVQSTPEIELQNSGDHASEGFATATNGVQINKGVAVNLVSTDADGEQHTFFDNHSLQPAYDSQGSVPNEHGFTGSSSLSLISKSLRTFIRYVTDLAIASRVPASALRKIHAELKIFLHAHLTQISLNRAFAARKHENTSSPLTYHDPDFSLRTFLHSIAAIHTPCSYSFTLYISLLGAAYDAPPLKVTGMQRYVMDDLCGCLARMCRLYNDLGSLERDFDEGNLNCGNFPEIWDAADALDKEGEAVESRKRNGKESGEGDGVEAMLEEDGSGAQMEKKEAKGKERLRGPLMMLASWERSGLEKAMGELEKGESRTDPRLMEALKVFVEVTDLFGQVYVVRDLASRKK